MHDLNTSWRTYPVAECYDLMSLICSTSRPLSRSDQMVLPHNTGAETKIQTLSDYTSALSGEK